MGKTSLDITARYSNTSGDTFRILEYFAHNKIIIKFGSGYVTTTSSQAIRRGSVRDKWKPVVFGVGINDLISPDKDEYYRKWVDMLRRCYDPYYLNLHDTYRGVAVCEDWKRFSTFKSWAKSEAGDIKGLVLDKDILGSGTPSKVYSPTTCLLITQKLNNFLLDNAAKRGKLPLGVSFIEDRPSCYSARCHDTEGNSLYLGAYSCKKKAHLAWRKKKNELLRDYINREKHPRNKEALLSLLTLYEDCVDMNKGVAYE